MEGIGRRRGDRLRSQERLGSAPASYPRPVGNRPPDLAPRHTPVSRPVVHGPAPSTAPCRRHLQQIEYLMIAPRLPWRGASSPAWEVWAGRPRDDQVCELVGVGRVAELSKPCGQPASRVTLASRLGLAAGCPRGGTFHAVSCRPVASARRPELMCHLCVAGQRWTPRRRGADLAAGVEAGLYLREWLIAPGRARYGPWP